MSDPRNVVAFEGELGEYITYLYDNTIVYDATQPNGCASVGLAVVMTGNSTVGLAADGGRIIGKLMIVESDGKCNVMVEGYTTLPAGNAATVTVGTKVVGALGASSAKGYIRNAASGSATDLLAADHEIVDVTDTTNVIIELS